MPKKAAKKAVDATESEKRDIEAPGTVQSLQAQLRRRVEGDIREEFTRSALGECLDLIAVISNNNSLSKLERLEAIERIQELATQEAQKLEPQIPDKAPALWVDRKNPDENPFVFAHRVYSDAAQIMVVSDYSKLDVPLGNILANQRNRNKPIPEGYFIETKKERDNDLVENPLSWGDLIAKLPRQLQRQFQAYNTARTRKLRSKPKSL